MTDMKTMFKFFAAALAIVAAASCAKENIQNPEEQPKVRMTFTASIDTEEDTKTVLNDKLVEWTSDDKITLYGVNNYSDKTDGYHIHKGYMTINAETLSDDKLHADFEGEVAASSNYCAFYPGVAWMVNTQADYIYEFIGFELQKAVKGTFDPSMHVMAASTLENGTRFNFKNICALAKVVVGESGVYSIKIEGVESTGNGSIGGTYRWKSGNGEFRFASLSYPAVQSKSNTITLKNENGAALEKGATYYIVLPACTIKNFTLSICDQAGNTMGTRAKASDFVVERNKIYDLGTLTKPTNYKIKNPNQPLQYAGNLEDGKHYMIFFSNASDHTKEAPYCWKVNASNGDIIKEPFSDKTKVVNNQYVFTYNHYTDISSFQSYESFAKGKLSAPGYNGFYLNGVKFNAQYSSGGTALIFANHWSGEGTSRCDIDIWRSEKETLCDNNGTLYWGSSSNKPRKFFFYEVELAY